MLHKALTVPCRKSQIIFYDSSRVKSGVVFPVRFKFPVKSICCIAFASAWSSTYCFLKSIAIIVFKWNMINQVNNQLYSPCISLTSIIFLSFVCSYVDVCMFICYFWMSDWTGFDHQSFICTFVRKFLICLILCAYSSNYETKSLATPSKLGSCK